MRRGCAGIRRGDRGGAGRDLPHLQCGRSGRVLIRAQVAAGRMAVLHDLILALQGVLMICVSNRVKAMMMIDIM
jgi:hypothetical protein